MTRSKPCQRRGEMRRSARDSLVLHPIWLDQLDRRRGFEIAVEIVESEELHFDRSSRRRLPNWRQRSDLM